MERRRFIHSFFEQIIYTLIGLTGGIILIKYLLWGKRKRKRELFIGEENTLKKARKKLLTIKGEEILIMWRGKEAVAFSLTCPHLGCRVRWKEWEKKFWCPCHGATFDQNGKVLSGPPPSPLKRYTVKKKGKTLYLVIDG